MASGISTGAAALTVELAMFRDGVDGRFEGLPRRELRGGLEVIEATTHRSRRRGLSRLDRLSPLYALHIPSTPSVHTFGMRFDLDLIWLARSGKVLRVDRFVKPNRMRTCVRARSVIETVAGEADAFLTAGDRRQFIGFNAALA
jgi:uncharacterized membrane protein (UPF0127 family)